MNELKRILLAEDSSKDVELMLAALQDYRLANEVVVVRDGAEAWEYLSCTGAHANRPPVAPAVVLTVTGLASTLGVGGQRAGGCGRGRRTTRHACAAPRRLGSIPARDLRWCLEGTGPVDPSRAHPPATPRLPVSADVDVISCRGRGPGVRSSHWDEQLGWVRGL